MYFEGVEEQMKMGAIYIKKLEPKLNTNDE